MCVEEEWLAWREEEPWKVKECQWDCAGGGLSGG